MAKVGVWLMPDNVRAGMLESLLLGLRAGNSALHDHARAVVARARELGAPFLETHREKAELHTWLAWEDPPGRQLHEAVRSKSLAPMPATSGPFVAWFRARFDV